MNFTLVGFNVVIAANVFNPCDFPWSMSFDIDKATIGRVTSYFHERIGRHLPRAEQRESFATYAFGIMSDGERAYQEMKGELGLDHFEGRSFPGWQHHVSIVVCCYAFIVAERVRRFSPQTGWQGDTEPLEFAA